MSWNEPRCLPERKPMALFLGMTWTQPPPIADSDRSPKRRALKTHVDEVSRTASSGASEKRNIGDAGLLGFCQKT